MRPSARWWWLPSPFGDLGRDETRAGAVPRGSPEESLSTPVPASLRELSTFATPGSAAAVDLFGDHDDGRPSPSDRRRQRAANSWAAQVGAAQRHVDLDVSPSRPSAHHGTGELIGRTGNSVPVDHCPATSLTQSAACRSFRRTFPPTQRPTRTATSPHLRLVRRRTPRTRRSSRWRAGTFGSQQPRGTHQDRDTVARVKAPSSGRACGRKGIGSKAE